MRPDRSLALVLCVVLACAPAIPAAAARGGAFNVLVGTEVSSAARTTMTPALWTKLVDQWVGENVIPVSGAPTIDDCHAHRALYMVHAPFDLKPRLPGTALHVNDRVAAQTHTIVTNCITNKVVLDEIIPLESNPVSTSNEGDLEPVPEITWESSIRSSFHAHPIVFASLIRIVRVAPPFVFIEGLTRGLGVGQTLRVFASSDGTLRNPPVIVTIVDFVGRQIEAQYDTTNPKNKVAVGDLIEPYTAIVPSK